ncbi:germination protein YpeB [Salibacterium halotolerans]|uniref:Spore germination protein n=1 Tax=Salibacterium halotolerans TaxID=1884432 RepID=A0A1I5Q3I0_9BACI|nr:germination protein YpeB [Salibacterium halotolerans]SFP40759.1 spore germination protein [Salibacterium halotolerans]
MIRNIIIGVLGVALIGTGIWGAGQAEQKEALRIDNENNYQRTFHDLTFHLDELQDKVGTTLAMNSKKQLSGSLADVWRISEMARSELGQLPIGMMALHDTEELLNKIGDFSYETTVRDLGQKPLSNKEYNKLQRYYEQSGEIKQDLRRLQASAMKNQLKWTEAEEAMAENGTPMDNSIANEFQTIDNKAKGFRESGSVPDDPIHPAVDEQIAEKVKGKPFTKEQAAKKAKQFLQLPESMKVEISELEQGAGYEGYTMTMEEPEGEDMIYMDMTKKGGHPLWFLQARPVDDQEISLNKASKKALKFLERNGFQNMEMIEGKQYDSIGAFQFAPVINGVKIYPETVYVEAALDDGEIVGFKGAEQLINKKERGTLTPALTEEEAEQKVNPRVKIKERQKAVIETENGDEAFCYEFFGTMNNDTYTVYINAENGNEEKVEKMKHAEPVYDTM